MNDLEQFERSLSTRLREAAEQMPLDPDALSSVRARAGVQRRRRRRVVATLASAAAAVIAVGAIATFGGGDPTTLQFAGPDGSDTPPTVATTAAAPSATADATLLTLLSIDHTPDGETVTSRTSVLFDGERSYWAYGSEGPSSELGASSSSDAARVHAALASLDATRDQPPEVALDEFLHVWRGESAKDVDAAYAVSQLEKVIWSGMATPDQMSLVRRLFEASEVTTVVDQPDGTVRVEIDTSEMLGDAFPTASRTWLVYDPATASMVAEGWGDGLSEIRFDPIVHVVREDVLVPGRGAPLSSSTTTTTEPGE